MTGCGEGFADNQGVACRVEIRSVNHRHLKCSIRTREGFHLLEPRLEGLIRERIKRGSLQITLEVSGSAVPTGRRLDQDQLGAYLDDWESFCDRRGITTPPTIDPLLGLPGVLLDAPPDASAVEATWPVVAAATSAAVSQLDTMRQSEGQHWLLILNKPVLQSGNWCSRFVNVYQKSLLNIGKDFLTVLQRFWKRTRPAWTTTTSSVRSHSLPIDLTSQKNLFA